MSAVMNTSKLGLPTLKDLVNLVSKPVKQLPGIVSAHPKSAAMVMAGGSGERFGRIEGKQLIKIAGRPILSWPIETFDAVADIGCIVVVVPPDRREEYYREAIEPYNFVTPIILADSGQVRQESAFSGLEQVPSEFEFVVVHDGVRPIIEPSLVDHLISLLKGSIDYDGVVVGHPAIDTLKVVEDATIMGTPDRNVFWNAQTPQVFRSGIYRRAHASALSDGFVGTDDSSLIERLGGVVHVVEGKRDNIKLTVPEDFISLAIALRFLRSS